MASSVITLAAPASPANTWFKAIQAGIEMPHNVTIEFDIMRTSADRSWAVLYGHSNNLYLFGADENGYPLLTRTQDGVTTILLSIPEAMPLSGHVVVSFRERRFREEASEVWHTAALWMNSSLIATHLENVLTVFEEPIRFGFAVRSGETLEISELDIPELAEFADWISIDPGEAPLRALERAIEGQYVKYFVRFNGRLRAWLPKASEPVIALESDTQIFGRERAYDFRGLKTHIRQLGAYAQAEYVRYDLIPRHGHKFMEVSNPYLMTDAECLRQAYLTIKRLEEETDVETITVYYNPILEPEDHFVTPSGDRIVTSRSIDYRPTRAVEEITGRKYTYGS